MFLVKYSGFDVFVFIIHNIYIRINEWLFKVENYIFLFIVTIVFRFIFNIDSTAVEKELKGPDGYLP